MINPDKMFGRLSNRMFQMAALYAVCRDNNWPIFVQDEKYFEKYKDEIKAQFSEGIGPTIEYVSIHVRRGKNPINPEEPAYSDNPFYFQLGHHEHENLEDNYYVRAMKMFPDEKFLVFSDDERWSNDFFFPVAQKLGVTLRIAEKRSDIEDMNRMASCKHNIIANSSFSWWAAWLNPNPDKIVVAPKRWFADPKNEHLIGIPKTWIRI